MGLLDRIAKQIATQVEKRALPAGSVTMTEQEMRNGSIGQSYGNNVPLGRQAFMPVAFGPGVPITPGAINPLRDDGRYICVRRIGKREFGETVQPVRYYEDGWNKTDRYAQSITVPDPITGPQPYDHEFQWRRLS